MSKNPLAAQMGAQASKRQNLEVVRSATSAIKEVASAIAPAAAVVEEKSFQSTGDLGRMYEEGVVYQVSPDEIADNPHNSRHFNAKKKFQKLVESILAEGQKDPVPVYWDKTRKTLIQTDGHTRKRAAKHLDRPLAVLITKAPNSDVELAVESFTRNQVRADETVLDEAFALASYKRLFRPEEFKALATKRGWNSTYISRLTDIAELPTSVCQFCIDTTDMADKQPLVTLRTLMALSRLHKAGKSEREILQLAQEYSSREITAVDLADHAKGANVPKKPSAEVRTVAEKKMVLNTGMSTGHLYLYPNGRLKIDMKFAPNINREDLVERIAEFIKGLEE